MARQKTAKIVSVPILPQENTHQTSLHAQRIALLCAIVTKYYEYVHNVAPLIGRNNASSIHVLCMNSHTYSKSMDQPRKVANPARGQLNGEN